MALTRNQILQRVAANANGEATAPSGDELSQWLEFLASSDSEWNTAYDFQSMVKTYNTTMAQSGTSVALPDDFKEKFAGYVKVNGALHEEFDVVEATIASGGYVTWGGNQSSGYYMNLSRALTSNASVAVPYHSRVTSLATSTAISPCPNPEFLVARTTEHVLLNRGQPEYVEFQQRADLLLQRMVNAEVSADMQKNNTIRTQAELDGFTLGED